MLSKEEIKAKLEALLPYEAWIDELAEAEYLYQSDKAAAAFKYLNIMLKKLKLTLLDLEMIAEELNLEESFDALIRELTEEEFDSEKIFDYTIPNNYLLKIFKSKKLLDIFKKDKQDLAFKLKALNIELQKASLEDLLANILDNPSDEELEKIKDLVINSKSFFATVLSLDNFIAEEIEREMESEAEDEDFDEEDFAEDNPFEKAKIKYIELDFKYCLPEKKEAFFSIFSGDFAFIPLKIQAHFKEKAELILYDASDNEYKITKNQDKYLNEIKPWYGLQIKMKLEDLGKTEAIRMLVIDIFDKIKKEKEDDNYRKLRLNSKL